LPGAQFTAVVTRTAGEISDDSRSLLTQLEVDNSAGKILAGSFGQLKFISSSNGATLTLPSNSVMLGGAGPRIASVNREGTIELRNVKLGRNFGQTIEILTGVSAGDLVVSNPNESLTTGMTVSVVEPTKNKESGQQ
jgi:hypothetical protein